MEIIKTIFHVIIELAFAWYVSLIFIQTSRDLWNEFGKENLERIKSSLKSTRTAMWYRNRKNNFEVISEKKFNKLVNKNFKAIVIE